MKKDFEDRGLHGNKIMESLSANIAQNSYYEAVRSSGLISTETWWTNSGKTQKIREITYTRTANLVTSIVTRQYNTSGTLVRTYTETVTRTAGLVTSIAGVET